MADRIKYSIGVTPIETLTDDESGSHDILASEINTRLGCNAEAVSAGFSGVSAAMQGYANGAVNYRMAIDSDDTTDISSETTATFVFIKNTGYIAGSDNTSTLGAALSKALKVMIGTTTISILDPGEAIVLKDDNAGISCTGIHVRTVDLDGSNNASAGHLAVEYLVVD